MRNALALALALTAGTTFAAPPPRVSYDAHSFKIDGKNTFIYSGAFHYFRCPKELWPARLKAIKDAGFNTIETYAAWNVHETTPPENIDDFTHVDLTDLDQFLSLAIDRFGFNIVIRPGPYICSEWDMGGFPSWILTKKPTNPTRKPWLRSDDNAYLLWSRHWYRAVDPIIAKHQITRSKPGGKGVILYQIENEYDYAGGSDEVHLNQLHALADQALKDGINVPLISCWTHQIRSTTDPILKDVVDCPNFYPRWGVDNVRGSIEAARNQQPGKPVMVTELQGGWFSEVGGLLAEDQEGITAAQERNLTLYCIQNGVTGTNYYMLFGGTNVGDRTPPNITTSYDYFAPIREDGSGGEKYDEVKALGEFLEKYGSSIATSSPSEKKGETDHPEVQIAAREGQDGTQFVFLRNSSHTAGFSGVAKFNGESFEYHLASFGSYVLVTKPGQSIKQAEWLPKAASAAVDREKVAPVHIASAWTRTDNGSSLDRSAVMGDVTRVGVFDNRNIVYRSTIGPIPPNTKLMVEVSAVGSAVVRLDGKILLPSGKRHGLPLFDLSPTTSTSVPLEVLYENPGRANFGDSLDGDHGLLGAKLISNGLADRSLSTWKLKNVTFDEAQSLISGDVDDSTWSSIELRSGERQEQLNQDGAVAVFRTTVDLSQADIDGGFSILDFEGIDDEGWIYVNGVKVGENHTWNQPVQANVKAQLHAGKNVIAVIVRNNSGQGGIYEVPLLSASSNEGAVVDWSVANLNGSNGHWESPDFDGWQQSSLDATAEVGRKIVSGTAKASPQDQPSNALTTWVKLRFDKPKTKRTLGLRVDALGNGLMWLNGHPLGRYWQVGPQREYYLPACWLKPTDNDVTISLRPVDGYAKVRSAEVTAWGE
jgi:hypothetical protein